MNNGIIMYNIICRRNDLMMVEPMVVGTITHLVQPQRCRSLGTCCTADVGRGHGAKSTPTTPSAGRPGSSAEGVSLLKQIDHQVC